MTTCQKEVVSILKYINNETQYSMYFFFNFNVTSMICFIFLGTGFWNSLNGLVKRKGIKGSQLKKISIDEDPNKIDEVN